MDTVSKPAFASKVNQRISAAFNLGSDAAIADRPLRSNPYSFDAEFREWVTWEAGWRDVEKHFGKELLDAS